MSDSSTGLPGSPDGSQKPPAELTGKYKQKGFQKISIEEYEAMRAKKSKRRKIKIPAAIKFVGNSVSMVIFCFGIIFVPWILYYVATHPMVDPSKKKDKAAGSTPTVQDSSRAR